MRRLIPLLFSLPLVLAACSSEPTAPNTPPPPTVSTSPPPASTTTTTLPMLEGAPPPWVETVANVYGKVCGGLRTGLPDPLIALPAPEACPKQGSFAVAELDDLTLAVAVFDGDAIYGVDEGQGFQVVAARLPSLGLDPGWYGSLPKLLAVVGSDARPGENVGRSRGDSIHIVGLDGRGAGGVVGVPRDSWVSIAGGRNNKINAALSLGGPEAMLATLSEVSGLELDGIVITGFEGFVELWDSVLEGAEVDVPLAIRDQAAKADLAEGRQLLDGAQALAFSRTRKTIPGGDLTRQFHGGIVLLGALGKVQERGPLDLPGLLSASEPWLVTDLTWGELLAWSALSLDTPLDSIGNLVVPARVGTAGSASVVYLTENAPAVFEDIADGAISPADD